MRYIFVSGLAGAATLMLATMITPAVAESTGSVIKAGELARVIRGKICVTRGGAKFKFTNNWHYAYDGLWTSEGHYSIQDGVVTVLLDSGLERGFSISLKDGVLYMEQTAISCE
jgi:hypothetical protein